MDHYIVLGGVSYSVKPLAVRQLRKVIPAVTKLIGELGPIIRAAEKVKAGATDAEDLPGMMSLLQDLSLSEQQFDLLTEAVWGTLTRTHPAMTKDDFLDLEMQPIELFNALPVVMEMTGLMGKAGEDQRAPGEPGPANP